jgi:hypothetical protein
MEMSRIGKLNGILKCHRLLARAWILSPAVIGLFLLTVASISLVDRQWVRQENSTIRLQRGGNYIDDLVLS